MKILISILILVTSSVFADSRNYTPAPVPLVLPAQTTYGLLALPNIPWDWGVPDKVQLGGTLAFTEGGNQSFAVGAATRFGGVLVHVKFSGLIDGPDSQDDYAIVVGGLLRY